MSVVISNETKGKDNFTLYVRGNEKGLNEILHLDPEERNNLKRLLVKIRNDGLKTMIFAKRDLDPSVAKKYINTFKLIRNNRKDQAEEQDS